MVKKLVEAGKRALISTVKQVLCGDELKGHSE